MIAPMGMSNGRLGNLVEKHSSKMHESQLGFWKFDYDDSLVFVITDESHNRMRIMTPVTELKSVPNDELTILLSANFDRALDARYCVDSETLWSAFIHPLQELSDQQFLAALLQVVTLAKNYGTSYSSSGLMFGG